MKYQGCEGCCGNMVADNGTTCEWCGGTGHHNGLFEVNIEVEGKTFTSVLTDVDGTYRFNSQRTGFSRELVVEIVGECWRWALAPEFSSWTPLGEGFQEQPQAAAAPPASSAARP